MNLTEFIGGGWKEELTKPFKININKHRESCNCASCMPEFYDNDVFIGMALQNVTEGIFEALNRGVDIDKVMEAVAKGLIRYKK